MPIIDGHIRCFRCRESKPLTEYRPSVVKAGCGECRACGYQRKREYEQRNQEKTNAARSRHRKVNHERHRETTRAHYRNNPGLYRGYNLGRYGITAAEYDAILAAQGGACACCGTKTNRNGKRLFVDHDHVTGAIRGVLCHKCNAGIGALGDNIDGLRRALAYLQSAEQQQPVRAAPALRINLLQGVN